MQELSFAALSVPDRELTWIKGSSRPPGGAELPVRTGWWLCADPDTVWRDVDLLQTPGLFESFALLAKKEETSDDWFADRMRDFASQYGFLSEPWIVEDENGVIRYGEPEGIWLGESREIGRATYLWELIREKDPSRVARHFFFEDDTLRYRNGPLEAAVARSSWRETEWRSAHRGDFGPILSEYLQSTLNEKLAKLPVSPYIKCEGHNYAACRLHIRPRTLLAAVWLQLAHAIEEERTFRKCEYENCGKFTEERSNKRFCSPTCKGLAHRKKRERARSLYGSGSPITEIASILETQESLVLKWIHNEDNG